MKKRALLVNDSKFESLILRDMLNKLDYDVEIADEFDAMYEIEQFNPDIIIVNYIMQEITGDELIEQIKRGMPDAKCLLSSSNTVKMKFLGEKKIDGILKTPASLFTLKDTLNRVGITNEISNIVNSNNISENKNYCEGCNEDISEFSKNIVFCPFCGDELR